MEKRKDGIEALFSRQVKEGSAAAPKAPSQQTKKEKKDDEPDASPARGKRKREPSSPLLDEVEGKKTHIDRGDRYVKTERLIMAELDEANAASEGADSDVEILPGPPVRVVLLSSLPHHCLSYTRRTTLQANQMCQWQSQRRRRKKSEATLLHQVRDVDTM